MNILELLAEQTGNSELTTLVQLQKTDSQGEVAKLSNGEIVVVPVIYKLKRGQKVDTTLSDIYQRDRY